MSVPNLCTFDTTLTFFDSSVRTFDQTTCQAGVPTVVEQQGGGGDRKRLRKKKRRVEAFKPADPYASIGALRAVETMSQFEIHQEMATLLHRKLRKDEEERAVLLLLAMLA